MSLFFSFEGGEGSGKTTIINSLYEELRTIGYEVIKTREPGGSKIAEEIRRVILKIDNENMDYKTEALLYAASRRQHLVEVIIPALNEGKIVLCDRYIDSSLAYQGHARGLGIDEVYRINEYAIGGLLPDYTIYIDVLPETGLKRIKKANREMDRLDLETSNFHSLVREGYLKVASMYPKRIIVLDGDKPIDDLYQNIKDIVIKKLEIK
jgi:dTMP kinase